MEKELDILKLQEEYREYVEDLKELKREERNYGSSGSFRMSHYN